jgi:hypothetical protein
LSIERRGKRILDRFDDTDNILTGQSRPEFHRRYWKNHGSSRRCAASRWVMKQSLRHFHTLHGVDAHHRVAMSASFRA